MQTHGSIANEAAAISCDTESEDLEPLRCWDCNVNFNAKNYLYDHLIFHIKQPKVLLKRVNLPPLKITIKHRTGNFEIVSTPPNSGQNSPASTNSEQTSKLAEVEEETGESRECEAQEENTDGHGDNETNKAIEDAVAEELDEVDEAKVSFSPNFAEVNVEPSPDDDEGTEQEMVEKEIGGVGEVADSDSNEYGSVPGAEPTPPPEPEYPKIRIKTTGLLKESLTITEITDDNPNGEPEINSDSQKDNNSWSSSMEDPLKLPGGDDILSLFNNNERAKDFGFTTSETEFMPLDRLDNRNQMQLYNPNQQNQNTLSSITGLPMEALAQQVSRLQPSGNGMHQQNVLINIQQFPPAPPAPAYPQHPPMHHYPQPMYPQPYQPYQPPNPMSYYPPAPGYPHMPPPPQPQMSMSQPPLNQGPMCQPPMSQAPSSQAQSMPPHSQPYRQPLTPRQPAPRQMTPQRMPVVQNRQPMAQRQPMARPRAPMVRPRGAAVGPIRNVRPRMPVMQNGQARMQQPIKRTPEQIQMLQAKKKRLDVLTPDKDDEDCQVICMQPKNTDGGLPQIQSVQGGTPDHNESSIMHLSDSITLSVRNPQPRPQSPKKSDAKAVANILATRGITVTATPKPKEKESQKNASNLPTSLNLNGAVSIIPSPKTTTGKPGQESQLPTVDLTDDASNAQSTIKAVNGPPKPAQRSGGLPFKCDLCPAQYPNSMGLNKHRQIYHKTTNGMSEIGVPLINLKQPGVIQKLSTLGIYNYIPLSSSGPDGMFALPVINGRNPGNVAALGITTMLSLGPVRNIPRPQNGLQNANKPGGNQK